MRRAAFLQHTLWLSPALYAALVFPARSNGRKNSRSLRLPSVLTRAREHRPIGGEP